MAGDKSKKISLAEVRKHKTMNDCWIILGNENNGTYVPIF